MKLFHNTDIENLESIKKQGLVASKSKKMGTKATSICLADFKPQNIPEYVDFVKCIYLTPCNSGLINGGFEQKSFETEDDILSNMRPLMIKSQDLNNKKLYCASVLISLKLTNLINENYWGVGREEKLTEMCNSSRYKSLCSKYWASFRPFDKYLLKYGKVPVVEGNENVEVLYFDDISPDKIQF